MYDVQRLRAWHRHVAALAHVSPPEARIVVPPEVPAIGRPKEESDRNVAVVAGSFNPVTYAHLSLCDGALQQPNIDAVWFLLAIHTVDKEEVTGACLEDRLCMLETLTQSRPNVGVVLCNRGLYVDQAEALHRAIVAPGRELVFVVGYDKIQQILDPRYYTDRKASLDRLFSLARFLVAERGTHGTQALDSLLDQKENHVYRERIAALTTLPAYHDPALSSTSVRTAYAQGSGSAAGATSVPGLVQDFIAATGVYTAPVMLPSGEKIDCYALRLRIGDALLAEPEGDFSAAEFQAAVALATSDSDSGRALRRLLAQDTVSLGKLLEHVTA